MAPLARLLLPLVLILASPVAAAQADHVPGPDPAGSRALRVLLVGNSLTYTNNLPRLLQAVASSQPDGPRIETATYAAPGAELSDMWKEGHAAQALRGGDWDVLVLQEQGGMVGCLSSPGRRHEPDCRRSVVAHREFTRLAATKGTRVVLFMTSRRMPERMFDRHRDREHLRETLEEVYSDLGRLMAAEGADVSVFPAAGLLLAPGNGDFDDHPFIDDMHPTFGSSLTIAAGLYAVVTGRPPEARDLQVGFPLLPPAALVKSDAPMEGQPQLAGDGAAPLLLKAAAVAPFYARAAAAD